MFIGVYGEGGHVCGAMCEALDLSFFWVPVWLSDSLCCGPMEDRLSYLGEPKTTGCRAWLEREWYAGAVRGGGLLRRYDRMGDAWVCRGGRDWGLAAARGRAGVVAESGAFCYCRVRYEAVL